jgi:hypothetical protein
MRRLLLIMLMLLFATASPQARLEETEQQCEARYGKPTDTYQTTPGSDKTLAYKKEGVRITAEFLKGRCQRISYSGLEGQQQVDVIIKSEGGPIWAPYGKRQLVRSDGLAMAQMQPDTDYAHPSGITFTLNVWEKAHELVIKNAEAAKKKAEKEASTKFKKGF